METKLEVMVLPVSDVDRAKRFYEKLGWRQDADFARGEDYRVVQYTPPGSACSIIFGKGLTSAKPGSAQGLHLVVSGVEESEIFHDKTGIFHHAGTTDRVPGLDPDRRSYGSFVAFNDPDGNSWFIQEVKQRAPGR
jgi:catechol 2,3-dioxygenase-like lactoylglutathione lyase family enzyme